MGHAWRLRRDGEERRHGGGVGGRICRLSSSSPGGWSKHAGLGRWALRAGAGWNASPTLVLPGGPKGRSWTVEWLLQGWGPQPRFTQSQLYTYWV